MKLKESLFKNFASSKYLEGLPDFKKKKTQQYSTLVLTLIALSLFGLLAIGPTISTIVQLQKQLEDSTFVNRKLEEKIKNLGLLQSAYDLIQNDIPIVLAAMPQSPATPSLVGQIQQLAQTNNISINRIQVFQVDLTKTAEGKIGYSSYIFSIDGGSSYSDTLAFLTSLTNFERIVSIDNLVINSGQTDKLPNFNIRGKAYFKK